VGGGLVVDRDGIDNAVAPVVDELVEVDALGLVDGYGGAFTVAELVAAVGGQG